MALMNNAFTFSGYPLYNILLSTPFAFYSYFSEQDQSNQLLNCKTFSCCFLVSHSMSYSANYQHDSSRISCSSCLTVVALLALLMS